MDPPKSSEMCRVADGRQMFPQEVSRILGSVVLNPQKGP